MTTNTVYEGATLIKHLTLNNYQFGMYSHKGRILFKATEIGKVLHLNPRYLHEKIADSEKVKIKNYCTQNEVMSPWYVTMKGFTDIITRVRTREGLAIHRSVQEQIAKDKDEINRINNEICENNKAYSTADLFPSQNLTDEINQPTEKESSTVTKIKVQLSDADREALAKEKKEFELYMERNKILTYICQAIDQASEEIREKYELDKTTRTELLIDLIHCKIFVTDKIIKGGELPVLDRILKQATA